MAAPLCNTVYVFTGLRNISVEVDEIVHGTPLCSRSSISSSDDYRLWSIATLRFSTFWTRVAFYIYVHRSVPGGVKNCERLAILVIMFFFCARAIFLTGYRVSFAAARMTDRSRFDKGIEIVSKVFGFAILSFITLSRYTMFYIICSLTVIFKKLFTLLALFVDRKDCSCKELSLFFDKFSKLKGVI